MWKCKKCLAGLPSLVSTSIQIQINMSMSCVLFFPFPYTCYTWWRFFKFIFYRNEICTYIDKTWSQISISWLFITWEIYKSNMLDCNSMWNWSSLISLRHNCSCLALKSQNMLCYSSFFFPIIVMQSFCWKNNISSFNP